MQGDALTDRFLRILTELAVTHCLMSEVGPASSHGIIYSFAAIDAYVRLMCTLIGSHGGGAQLLAKALSILSTGARRFVPTLNPEARHCLLCVAGVVRLGFPGECIA